MLIRVVKNAYNHYYIQRKKWVLFLFPCWIDMNNKPIKNEKEVNDEIIKIRMELDRDFTIVKKIKV